MSAFAKDTDTFGRLTTPQVLALAAFILGTSGCAALAPKPSPQPTHFIPCLMSAPPEPVWPSAALRPSDNIFVKAQTLLAEIDQRAAYELRLRQALTTCSDPDDPSNPPP